MDAGKERVMKLSRCDHLSEVTWCCKMTGAREVGQSQENQKGMAKRSSSSA